MHGVVYADISHASLTTKLLDSKILLVNLQATAHQGHMGRREGSWQAAAAAFSGGASIAAGLGPIPSPGCLHTETRASACFLPDPRHASALIPPACHYVDSHHDSWAW